MNYIKILVTGVGGGVGQSIMKALRISKLPIRIIAADINPLNAGLYRSDKAIIVPRVENKNALSWYIKNLNKHKIDILMVGSEYDLLFFSKNKEIIEKNTSCKICVSSIETVKISEDKFLTQEFLKKNQFPYLKTVIPRDIRHAIDIAKKLGFPVFFKQFAIFLINGFIFGKFLTSAIQEVPCNNFLFATKGPIIFLSEVVKKLHVYSLFKPLLL